jgi:hypothetical protein
MILRLITIVMAAMIFSGCNIQDSLLYYPSSSAPSEVSLKADKIKPWQSTTTDYRGFVASNEDRSPNGTIIVFHGNGGTAADRAFYVHELSVLGYRVILAEYPRYGGRKGDLGEKAFVKDAGEMVHMAYEQFGGPLFLLGESLGCGVAGAVAAGTSVKLDGIILITPWDTLASVAQAKFPFLPVGLFLTDKYDNIGNLRSFNGRIAVVGAARDEIVPVRHAAKLYNALPVATKRMWMIKEAGHNDWPFYTNMSWWKEIMDFMRGNGNSP